VDLLTGIHALQILPETRQNGPKMTEATAVLRVPAEIGVLIVDDEPLFLEMIEAMLEQEDDIEVVGKAGHGKRAVELARSLEPDVTIMDISMPVMNGIEATREIRDHDPNACVLILTGGSSVAEVDEARRAGASGYLTKDRIANDLIAEIRNLGGR
jgi:two-component system, NarL family, nitrate/nitrite response regulator NarL